MNDCSCEKTKGHFLYCLINIHLNKHSVQQNLNGKRGLLLSAIPQVNLYISLLPQSTKHLHSILLSCTLSFPVCQKIWKPCSFLALLSLCDPGLTRVPQVLLPWLGSHRAVGKGTWRRKEIWLFLNPAANLLSQPEETKVSCCQQLILVLACLFITHFMNYKCIGEQLYLGHPTSGNKYLKKHTLSLQLGAWRWLSSLELLQKTWFSKSSWWGENKLSKVRVHGK